MVRETGETNGRGNRTMENIAYIRQMLGELRAVAENEGADMLCYLIEMAYVEAGDVQSGRRSLTVSNRERHKSPGMPV
jgi:hypothetical protein